MRVVVSHNKGGVGGWRGCVSRSRRTKGTEAGAEVETRIRVGIVATRHLENMVQYKFNLGPFLTTFKLHKSIYITLVMSLYMYI